MVMTNEEKNFKLPVVAEGTRHFFVINSTKDLGFINYYEQTHNNINKSKGLKRIELNYNLDLHWIVQLEEAPNSIKEYVRALLSKKKMIVNGNINGTMFCNISNNKVNDSNFSNLDGKDKEPKRKHQDAEEGTEEEEDDPKEESVNIRKKPPEANGVIRSGKGVSPRPHLDHDLYNKHMEARCTECSSIPENFRQYIDAFAESENFLGVKKEVRSLSSFLGAIEDENGQAAEELELLEKILIEVHRSYSSHIDHNANEDAFNQLFVYPYMRVIAKSITISNCKADFVEGQPILESMTRQLKASNLYIDYRSQYKSDGLIKLFGLQNIELLLLETSGCFDNKVKIKLNFDHHKGMFGTLAMIKCIADEFEYASTDQFKKIKVFFLNAAGKTLMLDKNKAANFF
ncbi:hypothetical protein RO3G_00746 [Rhizopus delemar RA 99-880]|uniref:Uncharacterized protein n=1 Tax=Rhizopus delemar (strain RA 99-880 / ATCC MYA-4621 / FGSC 9543 / NRRL 43880) TaxID=246409 RepID=I1BIL2_RHIO9|nr:hypothetical protein RO3G_00746 [Rhizopus delemar RA 99-880]|eukprot:EIE76042.1 hypothetical protein RO3G_00746 [Rhizopus delemar RA 99-880]